MTLRRHLHQAHWRVFYTFPRAEKKCERLLDERGLHAFLPKVTVDRYWKNGKHTVVEPLFTSYIFARVTEAERIRVLQTDGIVRCVSFNGKVAEVTPEEIEQIKILLRDPARLSVVSNPKPKVGEKVVVMEGPLQGLRGEVIRHGTQTLVVVRIHAIRQAIQAHVPARCLQREPAYASA